MIAVKAAEAAAMTSGSAIGGILPEVVSERGTVGAGWESQEFECHRKTNLAPPMKLKDWNFRFRLGVILNVIFLEPTH
ncbi:hypothetical protein C4D60_Mb01t22800 [Musa balbisiana]|uniref:Uncharacterized protein n=1 Tax=Musa balbisiana TaxID=52838 RepID=A0A4S8JPE7_MUSBA|nr:hypothetical protein C4D60_Mb01t22800 [Musa balbisiana]